MTNRRLKKHLAKRAKPFLNSEVGSELLSIFKQKKTSPHGSETYKSQTYLNWLNYSSAPRTHQEKGFNWAEENSKAKGEKHKSQLLAHLKSSLVASREKPLQQGGREVEKIQKRREAAPPPPRHHRVASYHLPLSPI